MTLRKDLVQPSFVIVLRLSNFTALRRYCLLQIIDRMPWDLRQAKIQLREESLYRCETMSRLNDVHAFHLVVRQNSKRVAELFRGRLVLRYVDLRRISSPQLHNGVCARTHQEVDKRFKCDRTISLQDLVVNYVQIFVLEG